MNHVNRRAASAKIFALAGGATVHLLSRAQGLVRRVGYLAGRDAQTAKTLLSAFLNGMADLGYQEGRNFILDARYADGNYERFPDLAIDLVQAKCDVIVVVAGDVAVKAVLAASKTVPMVTTTAVDPVGAGYAESLAHPNGTVTGLTNLQLEVVAKQVELMSTVIPRLRALGFLMNPRNISHEVLYRSALRGAQGMQITVAPLQSGSEIEIVQQVVSAKRLGIQGLICPDDPFYNSKLRILSNACIESKLACVTTSPEFPVNGGLMSYGQNLQISFRRAAWYVDKILRGAKAGNLPFEQPTQLTFAVNTATAQKLGIRIPQSVLFMADTVL